LYAQDAVTQRADALDEQGRYEAARDLLTQSLTTSISSADQADIYARLSREELNIADRDHGSGKSNDAVISVYEQGAAYADRAIQADPTNAEGYFWKSGNIGKIGLLKGVMASLDSVPVIKSLLSKTVELDNNHAKGFYALGQLYAKLPGWPISFGSVEHAVSLARKAVELQEQDVRAGRYPTLDYGFYLELARDLHQRNWDAQKRKREQVADRTKYEQTQDIVERNFYYEGQVALPNTSDREEAAGLLQRTISLIDQKKGATDRDLRTLHEAEQTLAEWQRRSNAQGPER